MKASIDGLSIAYELIGSGHQSIAITAGGRYSKDSPGQRELAEVLAQAGYRVLIWDRVNCGESDVSFEAETESLLNARALAGLIQELDLGPTLLVGGSAGSRVSLLTAINYPECVAGLFLLWISGGSLGLAVLAGHYCYGSALAALTGGMQKVADLPEWSEQMARNSGNRDRMLKQNPETFVATMQRWAGSFFPKSDAPVPGLSPEQLAKLKMPAVVLRSGKSDLFHTTGTSVALAGMLANAELQEPPWGEDEWNACMARQDAGGHLWGNWPLLAPQIVQLAQKIGH